MTTAYKLKPLTPHFGAIVEGISLQNRIRKETLKRLEQDLWNHRLLYFTDQGKLSAETQLQISRHFGEIHSTFYKHPKSPHPDIFRVSNDEKEGCTRVGRSGWHIDGTFCEKPFRVQTMHFWSTNKKGSTYFCPLNEVINALTEDERKVWDKIYFVGDSSVHPLIYPHPETHKDTLCFHLGDAFFRCFAEAVDPIEMRAQPLSQKDSNAIRSRLVSLLEDSKRNVQINWKQGDFALIDNLAVGHYASPGTQADPKEGLRVLHRTTVAGHSRPLDLKLEALKTFKKRPAQTEKNKPASTAADSKA
ncbi:hypothetical protein AAMO2058_000944100 [Amorphochlora amoebiformis]